ncbi:MAG: beta-propeller domain-containing protein [Candidatus Woesearchaeota archaeon]
MKLKHTILIAVMALLIISILGCEQTEQPLTKQDKLQRFSSGEELVKAFEDARQDGRNYFGVMEDAVMVKTATMESAPQATAGGRDFSETNIQVQGVDEADIIKTDGDYIYTISEKKLYIIKAYPAEDAEIISTVNLGSFYPQEMFIHDDRLMIFGSTYYDFSDNLGKPAEQIMPRYLDTMTVKLYDLSNLEDPQLIRNVDFEGNYLTSRKIGEDVYFVVNSYPRYYPSPLCEDIIPLYRDSTEDKKPTMEEMQPIAKCTEIGYIPPIQAENFIIIASLSITDEEQTIEKEVIVGSGQNVYASLENIYIAQTSWPRYGLVGEQMNNEERTIITRLSLDKGKISYEAAGKVKGNILNQFSMDEFDKHFRIATTSGDMWSKENPSSNNIYVFDQDLKQTGALEDLAPGEKIYSVRFMGKKGYVVTFKKVDPLFVIDLSDHKNPQVLGKLKIPGYSDYLHPYDENHIIGIGKEAVEAEESLKTGRQLDFAWYQGVKMAIFDVSDVENPVELHKVVIGDRGTDSPVLYDHKAFLFNKDKELLVIPILLAEIKGEKSADNQYGDYTFQGAYVYNLNLKDGFDLRGTVTHYDDNQAFLKSGYYFRGDSSIKRSLYIEDVLYTLSDSRLQLNDLDDLEKLEAIELESGSKNYLTYEDAIVIG